MFILITGAINLHFPLVPKDHSLRGAPGKQRQMLSESKPKFQVMIPVQCYICEKRNNSFICSDLCMNPLKNL